MTSAASTTDTTSATGSDPGTSAPTQLEKLRARYPWLDHLIRAATRYTEKHGDHYAAAITYFSILALVPLIMIAFAAAAFVLANNQALLGQLQQSITAAAPPGLGGLLSQVVGQAIAQRNTVGIVGLLGALYSGLGWMSNLREALSEQWDQRGEPPTILGFLGLGDAGWAHVLFVIAGIVITLAADWLVFLWVIARLPREPVTLRSAARAALLAAVGFVVLQQVMTVYIGSVTSSPAGAAFGPIIGLLVFANFVSRFILFVTAWAATLKENEREELPEPAPVVVRPAVTVGRVPGPRATAGLLGAGALLGGVLGLGLSGRRRDQDR